jgi:hypothetical protein
MSDTELVPPPLWKCIGCLTPTPSTQWQESDGLCGPCWEGEWPRVLNQVPENNLNGS